MQMQPLVSLIVLSYNDGNSLKENLPAWINVLEQLSPAYEIIIADDGSRDNTQQVASHFITSNPNIKYVRSEKNQGVGANFRMGMQHATGSLVAYTDGDGQYVPEDLATLIHEINENDMVTGRRISRADPFIRSITSGIYNNLVRFIYPVSVKDINSGLKIFTRKFIDSCIPQISNGPFYDAEYLIKGAKKGMRIKEIPIGHQSRKYGQAAGVSLRSIRFLFSEVCKRDMKPFTRSNYFSKLMFRVLANS